MPWSRRGAQREHIGPFSTAPPPQQDEEEIYRPMVAMFNGNISRHTPDIHLEPHIPYTYIGLHPPASTIPSPRDRVWPATGGRGGMVLYHAATQHHHTSPTLHHHRHMSHTQHSAMNNI